MKDLSGTPVGGSGDELTEQLKSEVARWKAVVKSANIKFAQ
jgi:tripartite-type tricarboxylate transporter receptor subunit TctC